MTVRAADTEVRELRAVVSGYRAAVTGLATIETKGAAHA